MKTKIFVMRDYVKRTVQPAVRVRAGTPSERESFWLELDLEQARILAEELGEACDAIERNAARITEAHP